MRQTNTYKPDDRLKKNTKIKIALITEINFAINLSFDVISTGDCANARIGFNCDERLSDDDTLRVDTGATVVELDKVVVVELDKVAVVIVVVVGNVVVVPLDVKVVLVVVGVVVDEVVGEVTVSVVVVAVAVVAVVVDDADVFDSTLPSVASSVFTLPLSSRCV